MRLWVLLLSSLVACGGKDIAIPSDPTPAPTGSTSADSGTSSDDGNAALGERLFDDGIGANGTPVVFTGGVDMPTMRTCAGCHGVDGHGLHTMMFTSPNITYANLTDPLGMIEPDGTRGMTYTDDLIRRAVTQGVDADGAALDETMPRWELDDTDWADLLAYLKTLK